MMNNAWKEFFAEHEPKLAEEELNCVEDNTLLNDSTWLSQLKGRAILKVNGSDATEFLHGQFSNDLKQLGNGQWQLSSYSTPKGRLLAVFRIAKSQDNYYLEMPSDIAEAFQKRLQMFVMRSDVALENLHESMVICGFVGTDAQKHLDDAGFSTPNEVYGFTASENDGVLLMREFGEQPRYLVIAQTEKMIAFWKGLDSSVLRTTENSWNLSQVEQGQPDVFDSTKEQFVAQMMNLHVLGAVNFKKGCYPGQEVVARLQYLGKLKRRMYRFSVQIESLPVAGSEIFVEGEEAAAGKLAVAAFKAAGVVELLAVMKVASVESGAALKLNSGEVLTSLDLPYAFAEES